jgi:hypothetical protein
LNDLKLSDKKKETAEAAVKAHGESTRKLIDLARADLLLKMKDILSDDEFKTFKAELDRGPRFGGGDRFGGRGGPGGPNPPPPPRGDGRTADLERKIEQLQKEVDDLKRQLKR